MQRRNFLHAAVGTFAAGAFAGIAPAFAAKATNDAGTLSDVASFTAALKYAKLRQGRIAYIDRGKGDVVLFMHGFPVNSYQWRGMIERLQGECRCVAPDFLALGRTQTAPGQSVTPAAQVEMITTLLDHLKIDKVHIVANDSGIAVAQLYVIAYPDRVRTLLLTTGDTEVNSPPPGMVDVIAAAHAGKFGSEMMLQQVNDKEGARNDPGQFGGLCFTYPHQLTDETIEYYLRPLTVSPERQKLADAYALGLDPNPLAGVEAKLKKLQHPVRVVWGTGDTIFRQEDADYLSGVFPKSRGVRRVEGAKLFFPEEFPDLLAEEQRALRKA